ncbi:hypothetical protein QCM77_18030 [Bradyrhizobium sp. SSUT18]|uniref:hypothetical protein n=1 Tax=Bradyrhizobium sp. SSUT18 TaxID=3040602 RepID=UPI00244982A0|nr:hypothetical protein [Bradyrhizobium sp. SSUT18]MDH2401844.1 hypothetical protein [Bradyrhizobium sp. SSUT18]
MPSDGGLPLPIECCECFVLGIPEFSQFIVTLDQWIIVRVDSNACKDSSHLVIERYSSRQEVPARMTFNYNDPVTVASQQLSQQQPGWPTAHDEHFGIKI